MAIVQRIAPCLWFDNQAEEAAKFYVSIFENSAIGTLTRYGREGFEVHGRPEGSVMTVSFRLADQEFTALNGGPYFKFTEAISFVVKCETQAEVAMLSLVLLSFSLRSRRNSRYVTPSITTVGMSPRVIEWVKMPNDSLLATPNDFDFVRTPDERNGHGRIDVFSGDAFHLLAQLRDVLNVDGCNHLDPGVEEFLNILPAGWIPGPGRVIVSQTINEADGGMTFQNGEDINRGSMIDWFERDHLQFPEQLLDLRRRLSLHSPDDHVLATLAAASGFVEHTEGFAHARCVAKEDLEIALGRLALFRLTLAKKFFRRFAACVSVRKALLLQVYCAQKRKPASITPRGWFCFTSVGPKTKPGV